MVGDDAEHTRFPCLATVRSLVAAVVTVLAVAVVVMVIVVVNRPEDFSVSMSRGYIQSEKLWWNETEETKPADEISVGSVVGSRRGRVADPRGRGVRHDELPAVAVGSNLDDYGFGQIGERPKVVTVTTYAPATPPVYLRVTWSAYNPSGRGPIECNVTAIRVFDMPNAPATGMEIANVSSIVKPLRFSVPSGASHTETLWVAINGSDTLQYIYEQYQGKNSFLAMVQVTATGTSKATPISRATDSVDYYCWPVKVVHGIPDEATAFDEIHCSKDYPVAPPTPSAAPAPAPAGGYMNHLESDRLD